MVDFVRVVALGSSAGGLEALSASLGSVAGDVPFAFVVAQHQSPDFDSPLVELLARVTALRVQRAEEGAQLEAGLVLVCPPHTDVEVSGSTVRLSSPGGTAGPHPDIDGLLTSIAKSWGSRAVGLVLSGTGHDGAAGIRAIHANGGVALAQDPTTAEFDSMPRAASATGAVDVVLPPAELGTLLGRLPAVDQLDPECSTESQGDHLTGETTGIENAAESDPDTDEAAVVEQLRLLTEIDFSEYKQATLHRQIARRQALVGAKSLADYRSLLKGNREEATRLSDALLVTVTAFFRDPESWSALAEQLAHRWSRADEAIERRIWVPGCASGQEAYTLAMICADLLGSPVDLSHRVKIFATDLREDALDVGRLGRYTDDDITTIPEEFLATYWRRGSQGWEVSPILRDAIIFARHNMATDPPFPRMDLISVRNTLIYFREPLQRRTVRLFRYALRPQGLLFLGSAERVAEDSGRFSIVDSAHRVYARSGPDSADHDLPMTSPVTTPSPAGSTDSRREALLTSLLPPSLITDANDDVLDVVGDVSPWCWVAPGPPSTQATALLRDELRIPVRTLLLRLRHGHERLVEAHAQTEAGPVIITGRRLVTDRPGEAVITFTHPDDHPGGGDFPASSHDQPSHFMGDRNADMDTMTRELESTQAALQGTVEDLSASNEQLRALNEELQASSEEAQSANEELQATNEELSTLNQELQVRTSALVQTKRDLENTQASISAGLILVDRDFRITSFTAPAVRVFALIEEDLGRQLTSIPTTVPVPDLDTSLREAVVHGQAAMSNASGQGNDYLVQVQPYVDDDARVVGAVVVVTDTSELASAQREVSLALHQFHAVTDALSDTIWQRNRRGELTFLSLGVEQLFGLSRDRVLAHSDLLLDAVDPADRARVVSAMAATSRTWDLRYRICRPDGSTRWVQESAQPMIGVGDDQTSGYIRDVTVLKANEEVASRRQQLLEAILGIEYLAVVLLDRDHRIVRTNPAFAHLSGYDATALIGMPIHVISDLLPDPGADPAEPSDEAAQSVRRHRLIDKDGNPHWVAVEVHRLAGILDLTTEQSAVAEAVDRAAVLVTIHDLTPMVDAAGDLEHRIRYDQQTGLLARAEFRSRVSQELARCRRKGVDFGVLWVDLDGFKEVNDTYGHRSGDRVLAEVANRLRRITRGQDDVGRLGGDEFGVLITDIDGSDSLELASARVNSAIREPISDSDTLLFVTASVGVAVAPEDGTSADTLLHSADTAMYVAKNEGGDSHAYFRSSMNEASKARGAKRQELAAAVRAADFRMHYQPIVDVTSGDTVMVEALVRWQRGDELVNAGEFIVDAEQTGQLRAIGLLAHNIVEHDLIGFDTMPGLAGMPVCINFSPDELDAHDLTARILRWHPPGGLARVVIEVTEQSLLPGAGQAMDSLLLLQRLGARISIDDFGTGYSNMALLGRLRPDFIKIDRTLLVGASEDPRIRSLLSASIQMAHALQSQVVVEGVEIPEQGALLAELGVDFGQGYLYARPMSLAALETWISERRGTLS